MVALPEKASLRAIRAVNRHSEAHFGIELHGVGPEGPRVVTVTPERKVRYQKVQLGRDFGTEVELLDGLRSVALTSAIAESLRDGRAIAVTA